VKPSYGLDDAAVERMLVDALDHGERPRKRQIAEARVEAKRILGATAKGLATDATCSRRARARR